MGDNVTEEFKPNPCYWCGSETMCLHSNGPRRFWLECGSCDATSPPCDTQKTAIEKWNSLASRLKPQPKKVTLKRWVNVYAHKDEFSFGALRAEENYSEDRMGEVYIDTVEVEINFTDRRGCE